MSRTDFLDALDICRDCWELAEEMIPAEVTDEEAGRLCRECADIRAKDRADEEEQTVEGKVTE